MYFSFLRFMTHSLRCADGEGFVIIQRGSANVTLGLGVAMVLEDLDLEATVATKSPYISGRPQQQATLHKRCFEWRIFYASFCAHPFH